MDACNGGGTYRNRFYEALRVTGVVPPIAPMPKKPFRRVAGKNEYGRHTACAPIQGKV